MNKRYCITATLLAISAIACAESSGTAPARPLSVQAPSVTPAPAAKTRSPTKQASPASDRGIVKTPPSVGASEMIERPPRNVDPGMLTTPPVDATRGSATGPGTLRQRPPGSSRQDDCKGLPELCKQNSAR